MNAPVTRGHIVLITGMGGGVALLALKLCLVLDSRVYVTSSSDAKIARAVALGAACGVNYTHSQYGSSTPLSPSVFFFNLHFAFLIRNWPKMLESFLRGIII